MNLDLAGKRALVTGSTSGIGRATAAAFARAGADVVVNGRDDVRVADAVRELRVETGSDRISGVAADVGTADGVAALVAAAPDVDILVNNAGIFAAAPVFEIPDAEWLRFFEVNVLSGIRLARHHLPRMVDRGWGRVIFVSSEAAVFVPTEMMHYAMTKTAQVSIARGMAQEVRGTGVTVNTILPGPTRTPGVDEFIRARGGDGLPTGEAEVEFMARRRPTSLLGRLIRPDEIANLITFVASELSSATTGAALRADGGVTPTII